MIWLSLRIFRLDSRTSKYKSRKGVKKGEEDVDKVGDQEVVRGCDVEAGGEGAEEADLVVEDVEEGNPITYNS